MFFVSLDGQQIYKPLDDLLVIFNPKLTLEIGKAGSFEFDIPPNNPFYDRLNQLTTDVTVDMDSEEIFHGRVLSVERTFSNIRHVYCEGDLSYLIDSVQKGVKFNGTTHQLFNMIINNHNARVDNNKKFTVGIVNIENRPVIITGKSEGDNINVGYINYKQIALDSIADEWNNTFDYIQNCIIDYCGGYLRTRRVNGTMYIDLLDDFGNNATQPVELGKNILDLTEELAVEDLFTVLIPLGDDNLTIASVNGGSDELVDRGAVARYGRIVRTHVFNNVNSPYTLMENGRRFLQNSINLPRTITVRAVDLHLVNKDIAPIHIGDKVEILSYVHEVNDILMCTKIEYDLEHPENNNYTFGNPKQTLTQRYREDLRQSASANSPSSAAAAGASAAAATAKEAEKEKDKALKDFYDTWIDEDKEHGTLSLGALYKKYMGDRHVLINQCGIDFDASSGNVDLNSLHNVVDSQGRQIAQNTANIRIVQDDYSARVENVVQRQSNLEGYVTTNTASITQQVNDLSSQINITSQTVAELDDALATSIARIETLTTDQEARISQSVQYTRTVDGKAETAIAAITAVANDLGTEIRLKADKTYVDGELNAIVGNFERLTSGTTVASRLRATEIIAGSLSYWDSASENTVAVPSMNHSHQLLITEGNNGDVEVRLGMATTAIPQVQSFNIANTRYFRDHVAAVSAASIESLNPDSYSTTGDYTVVFDNAYVRYSNNQIVGRIRIALGNNEFQTAVVKMAGDRAYNAGVDDGAETAIATRVNIGTVGSITHDSEDDIWYGTVSVSATAQGTRADGSTYTSSNSLGSQQINVTAAYEAGLAAGSGQAAGDVTATVTMSGSQIPGAADNAYITANAALSNGNSASSSYSIYLDAVTNTASAVTMQIKHGSTVLATKTITPISDAGDVTATVDMGYSQIPGVTDNANITATASLSNGATATGSYSIYLDNTSNTESAVTMQLKHGSTVIVTKTVTPVHPSVTATVDMGYAQIPGVADNANITATASLSNGGTASGSYSVYLDATTNTESSVVVQLKHGSTVIASKTITPTHPNVTASVSITGAQVPSAAANATITATATLSNGGTASNGYSIYLESTTNTESAVTMQVAHGIGANKVILATKTVTPTHPNVTASVSMGYLQIPGVADNANITATASLSNGTTASNSYSIYLDTVTNTSSAVTMAVKHGSTVIISKTVTPVSDAGNVTATVSMSGAQIPSVATNANITATASLSNGATASNSYSIYLESVANTTSTVTMQVAHGSGSNKVILASKSVTPTHPTVSISSATGVPTSSSDYNTDFAYGVGLGSSSVYATGSDIYGKVKVTLSSGVESIVRVRVTRPPTTRIEVTRSHDPRDQSSLTPCMQDWDLSETGNVYINVNLEAFSGNTSIGTATGKVNVNDIVGFWDPTNTTVLANNTAQLNDIYDLDVNLEGYSNQYYVSGTNRYARIKLTNERGDQLKILRVQVSATSSGGSGTGTITLSPATTSSSVNPYYGTLTDYAWINNRHYCRIHAVATGDANSTQYYDINDIVNYAYQLGGGGSSPSYSSMTLYCVSRSENSSGLIQLTFSAGSYSNLPFYQGNSYTVYY